MLIFRMVPTNTGKSPIPANLILFPEKTNALLNLRTSPGTRWNTHPLPVMQTRPRMNHWHDASIFIGFCTEAVTYQPSLAHPGRTGFSREDMR